jgi:hypothetical protein
MRIRSRTTYEEQTGHREDDVSVSRVASPAGEPGSRPPASFRRDETGGTRAGQGSGTARACAPPLPRRASPGREPMPSVSTGAARRTGRRRRGGDRTPRRLPARSEGQVRGSFPTNRRRVDRASSNPAAVRSAEGSPLHARVRKTKVAQRRWREPRGSSERVVAMNTRGAGCRAPAFGRSRAFATDVRSFGDRERRDVIPRRTSASKAPRSRRWSPPAPSTDSAAMA